MATEEWKKNNQEKLRKYRLDHYYRNQEHYKNEAKEYKKKNRKPYVIPEKKICRICKDDKLESEFDRKTQNGREYLRYACRECSIKKWNNYSKEHPYVRTEQQIYDRKERRRQERLIITNRPKHILKDAKTSDRRKNKICNLTVEYITDLIANGCLYCGDNSQDCLMTLDRIDNTQGHTKDNVNPSCYRCNLLRRDMPYSAWLNLVPSIRQTHEMGLFGDWHRKCIARKNH